MLESTRFYGPMTFHLIYYKKIENFVAHLLNSSKVDDALKVIKLYYIVHDEGQLASFESSENKHKIIEDLIKNRTELVDVDQVKHAYKKLKKASSSLSS